MRRAGNVFIADTAVVTGAVKCGQWTNIWYGAVLRGDVAAITLGENVNIQDNVVVHCDFDVPNLLETGVVVGHSAVIHGKRVGQNTLIGIGAKLLSDTDIGEESIIAAGAVLVPGTIIPPRSVVMGMPGKVVRTATAEEIARTKSINLRYREMALLYADGKIDWPFGRPQSLQAERASFGWG